MMTHMDWLGVGLVGLTVFAWAIRQEAKLGSLQHEIDKLEARHDALEDKIMIKLSAMEKVLYNIQGRLRDYNHEGEK